ncbi:MAG: GNAT family N-acetyltransferase [Gaiellales bacterium]
MLERLPADIASDRLSLSPMTSDDLIDFLELDSDPEVMRLLNGGHPSTLADVERRLATASHHTWAARAVDDGRFVGWFSLTPTAPAERELGYRLRRPEWGKGFASEGACALVDLAFADPRVRRVWAQTMTVNDRSRKVLDRVGLQYVRTFFGEWDEVIPGGEHGDVEYELTRAEWLRRR